MDYPQKIKLYREKEFLSQSDLAKLIGVSFVTVNRWERGHYLSRRDNNHPSFNCYIEAVNEIYNSNI